MYENEPIKTRLKHAWNVLVNKDPTPINYKDMGYPSTHRPDRVRMSIGNEKSIVTAIYNRIAVNVSSISIVHARLDKEGRYVETINSDLNEALNVQANIDQTGKEFIKDVVMSMFDEGCVAIVPVDTQINPLISGSYDIQSMRTGQVLEWFPSHVRVRIYNDKKGIKEDVVLPKAIVAIIENPFYAVMNEPNSTLQRLITKLNLLDAIDNQSGSGKLDLIIQLPYVIRNEQRREQAEKRRKDIEDQLAGSKYGIAYTDGTEKVTQLNRAVENNLMAQIEFLTNLLFSQLGMTQSILDGTANEEEMLNYYSNVIEPVLTAISENMKVKFLTKTARTQRQTITFFRDPFKLVPVKELANVADRFTRNEVLSSNEVRAVIGYKPVQEERADQLVNKNIANNGEASIPPDVGPDVAGEQEAIMNDVFSSLEADIDKLLGGEEK